MMTIPSPIELIQASKGMYLGSEEASGRTLAIRLADCALISGARRVEILMLDEGWTGVSSDGDWITPNIPQQAGSSIDRAFANMIPLRGGQQNEIRFEVVLSAFSSCVGVKNGDHWSVQVGDLVPQDVRDHFVRSAFAVVV